MGGFQGYAQFCPIARAAEVFGARWTTLVVRELICGSVRFNDIQRGVPRMSSALLAQKLKELEHLGLVEKLKVQGTQGSEYHATPACKDVFPMLEAMGNWSQKWLRYDLVADENLDPDLLMWDIRRTVSGQSIKRDSRLVVAFRFFGVPADRRNYWLLFERNGIDLCFKDPGFEFDLFVSSHIRTLTEIWLGHLGLQKAIRDESLSLDGNTDDIDAFASWFSLSIFAPQALGATDETAASARPS